MQHGVKVGRKFECMRDDGTEFEYNVVLGSDCVIVETGEDIFFDTESQIDAFAGVLKDFMRLGRNIAASADGFDLCKLREYIEPPSEEILAWVTVLLKESKDRAAPCACGKTCRDVEF